MMNNASNSRSVGIARVGLEKEHRGKFWIGDLPNRRTAILAGILRPRWLTVHYWKTFSLHCYSVFHYAPTAFLCPLNFSFASVIL